MAKGLGGKKYQVSSVNFWIFRFPLRDQEFLKRGRGGEVRACHRGSVRSSHPVALGLCYDDFKSQFYSNPKYKFEIVIQN